MSQKTNSRQIGLGGGWWRGAGFLLLQEVEFNRSEFVSQGGLSLLESQKINSIHGFPYGVGNANEIKQLHLVAGRGALQETIPRTLCQRGLPLI